MSRSLCVDLNCDMGEGYGSDAELLTLVTSANIACGGHTGDAASMDRAIELALQHGAAVGAHPGYVDRDGFGRRELAVEPSVLGGQIEAQVRALAEAARTRGTRLSHVKLHGALYSVAARDHGIAAAVLRALARASGCRTLFALAGSALVQAARADGFTVAEEGFADRAYRSDGTLATRGTPGAMIADPVEAARRAVRMVRDGTIQCIDGQTITVRVDTICIHGDEPGAVQCALALRDALQSSGVRVRRFDQP
jgi:5-oxoprolinase (ATP-hydrolysing) subunit A